LGKIGRTKFSIFCCQYPLIAKPTGFGGIHIASKEDIAAMKIHAIEERGTKRDFIDLYFLARDFSMEQMLDFYNQKYGVLEEHLYMIIRSLDYFAGAEDNDMPQMIERVSWKNVKKFFQKQAMRLAQENFRI